MPSSAYQPRLHLALLLGGIALLGATGCGPEEEAGNGLDAARIQAIGDARGGTEDDLVFVRERLASGDDEERTAAAWALGRAGGPGDVPGLERAARDDSDRYVRINSITSLGNLGGPHVEEVLVDLLGEDDMEFQATVLRALGNRRYLGAFRAVGEVLKSEHPEIREVAADALASMGEPEAVPFLEAAAGDPEKDVRSMVAFALGKVGDEGVVPLLTGMLEDAEWEVRANAAQALGMIGEPSARSALEKAGDDPSSQVQAAARRALGRLSG